MYINSYAFPSEALLLQYKNTKYYYQFLLCLKLKAPVPSIVPAAKLSPIAGEHVCF